MAPRRDWLLQQMGIMQWTLRRPAVLKGEIAVTLPAQTRLVIIAASFPTSYNPLISDVLHSLSLRPEQVYPLTPEQITMLPASAHCHIWCLGVDIRRPPAWTGVQLSSPTLDELYANPSAKRALWQKISEHLPLLEASEAN
ncbi:MAG: DNA polymerase III subunit psi [Candidatus Malihini olakiniferum]